MGMIQKPLLPPVLKKELDNLGTIPNDPCHVADYWVDKAGGLLPRGPSAMYSLYVTADFVHVKASPSVVYIYQYTHLADHRHQAGVDVDHGFKRLAGFKNDTAVEA